MFFETLKCMNKKCILNRVKKKKKAITQAKILNSPLYLYIYMIKGDEIKYAPSCNNHTLPD